MYVYIHVFFRGTSVNFIVGFWFRSQKKKRVRMKRMAAAEWGEILQSLSSTHTGGKRRGFKVMVIAPPPPLLSTPQTLFPTYLYYAQFLMEYVPPTSRFLSQPLLGGFLCASLKMDDYE